uniref:Uncharacterized protein n=1 Tax=Angiostrongylus cantonensis TaxID=6313 RepID=A0A0K0CTD1_ANGCA
MVESALVGHLLDPRSPLNIESLLDAVTALLIDCKIPSLMRIKSIDSFITRCKFKISCSLYNTFVTA